MCMAMWSTASLLEGQRPYQSLVFAVSFYYKVVCMRLVHAISPFQRGYG